MNLPEKGSAERIDRWVDGHRGELTDFLARLVRIPTENIPPNGHELAGQRFLQAEMEKMGWEVDVFSLDEVEGLREHPAFFATVDNMERNYRDRPNVVGALRGTGGGKSLIFTGHMDTVVREPVPWRIASDPFSGEVIGGRLYGRGSYDMKAGLVCALYAMKAVQELGFELKGDVFLESVVDEEYGGANGTLAARLRGYNADMAICPEPTALEVCTAHLGWLSYKITVEGSEHLNPQLESMNPLYVMAEIVSAIRKYERLYPTRVPPGALDPGQRLPIYVMQQHSGSTDYASVIGVPKSVTLILGMTTCLGMTEEGISRDFESFLRAHVEAAGMDWGMVSIEHPIRYLHPSKVDENHPFFDAVRRVYEERALPPLRPKTAGFACDAFISNLYTPTPTVLIGPDGGNAHARDEYVDIESVVELTKRFASMIVHFCG